MEQWIPLSSGHNNNIIKAAKEEFVSNLDGTSPWEVLLIASTVPLGLYVFLLSQQRSSHSQPPAPRRGLIIIIIEFLSFWFPAILCQTVWSFPWAIIYFTALLLLILSANYCHATAKYIMGGCGSEKQEDEGNGNTKNISTSAEEEEDRAAVTAALAVTTYRAALLCLTCVAILAVDFPLFPRRLAKTEVYGYGWMDLGAASFVIAAGIVSTPAKRRISAGGTVVPRQGGKKAVVPLQRILPMLFMGILRLVTHKNIDYQEHASEYGVHWNFFFTLAVLTLLSSLVMPLSHHRPNLIIPCIVMVLYQVALSSYGGQEWIETAPRYCARKDDDDRGGMVLTRSLFCDLLVANREGILGCIGYGALFFVSEWVASVAIWTHRVNLWSVVSVLGLIWWTLVHYANVNVSRRSTNATFCVWALLVNMLQLTSIRTVLDYFFTKATTTTVGTTTTTTLATRMKPPPLLDALNRNGLLAFVLANLLTGLVNLTVDTLHTSHAMALWILILYLAAVAGLAVALERVKTIVRRGKGGGKGEGEAAGKRD